MRHLQLNIPLFSPFVLFLIYVHLLLAIGITGWLVLDARVSTLEERAKANRAAELHIAQSEYIVNITNDLSDRIRRLEEQP